MSTRKMMIYVLVASSRATLRPHLPSAAQIRRGAYPHLAPPAAALIRVMILLLGVLCGVGATSWISFHSAAPSSMLALR